MKNREEDTELLAKRLLQVLMPLGKSVTAELRNTGQLLAPGHFHTMGALYLRSTNLSELAELLGVSLPTMSNTVRSLEQQGWIERQRSREDRRKINLALTAAGCDMLSELTNTIVGMLVAKLEKKTPAERKSLSKGLSVLESLFDAISLPEGEGESNPNEGKN
jgi:DNA-binding MarR family transcriptional regulator